VLPAPVHVPPFRIEESPGRSGLRSLRTSETNGLRQANAFAAAFRSFPLKSIHVTSAPLEW